MDSHLQSDMVMTENRTSEYDNVLRKQPPDNILVESNHEALIQSQNNAINESTSKKARRSKKGSEKLIKKPKSSSAQKLQKKSLALQNLEDSDEENEMLAKRYYHISIDKLAEAFYN